MRSVITTSARTLSCPRRSACLSVCSSRQRRYICRRQSALYRSRRGLCSDGCGYKLRSAFFAYGRSVARGQRTRASRGCLNQVAGQLFPQGWMRSSNTRCSWSLPRFARTPPRRRAVCCRRAARIAGVRRSCGVVGVGIVVGHARRLESGGRGRKEGEKRSAHHLAQVVNRRRPACPRDREWYGLQSRSWSRCG